MPATSEYYHTIIVVSYHAIIETNKFDLIRLIQRVLKGNSI